jgi:hypothetical protein
VKLFHCVKEHSVVQVAVVNIRIWGRDQSVDLDVG